MSLNITMKLTKSISLKSWALLLPALTLLFLFTYLPAIKTLWRSFFIAKANHELELSLDNFRFLLEDDILHQVLANSLYYALITVPVSIMIALMMALWVNKQFRGSGFLRMAYFTPTILPMITVASIWLFFYSPEIGLFNTILNAFGFGSINWLGNPNIALYSLMLMTIWKEAGFFMIFYLAALQQISPDYYQAAQVEGAKPFYTFRRITFPLLMPTTLFVMVNALLNSFKLVDHLFILTKGGPNNASNLLLYYIYETAFSFLDFPYAATLTLILLGLLISFALIQFTVIEKRVHYR